MYRISHKNVERRMWYLMVFNGIWFRCCTFYKRVFSTETIKYRITIVVEKKKDSSQMVKKIKNSLRGGCTT